MIHIINGNNLWSVNIYDIKFNCWSGTATSWNDGRSSLCIFYEETDEFVIAESIVRICGGCYGGCIYLEPADSGDGVVGSNGEACISSSSYRFLAGNYIFITDRYSDATFTY